MESRIPEIRTIDTSTSSLVVVSSGSDIATAAASDVRLSWVNLPSRGLALHNSFVSIETETLRIGQYMSEDGEEEEIGAESKPT